MPTHLQVWHGMTRLEAATKEYVLMNLVRSINPDLIVLKSSNAKTFSHVNDGLYKELKKLIFIDSNFLLLHDGFDQIWVQKQVNVLVTFVF